MAPTAHTNNGNGADEHHSHTAQFPLSSSLSFLVPPIRFSLFSPCLYRGGYPNAKNYRFLARLHLKTIISLTPEPPIEDLKHFMSLSSIDSFYFPTVPSSDTAPLSADAAARCLELLVNKDKHPLYIHCLDGANITSLVVACLRKLECCCFPVLFHEFQRFARDRTINKQERKFIQQFQESIYIPINRPQWLWQGALPMSHPTMRLSIDPSLLALADAPAHDSERQQTPEAADREETAATPRQMARALHSAAIPSSLPSLAHPSSHPSLSSLAQQGSSNNLAAIAAAQPLTINGPAAAAGAAPGPVSASVADDDKSLDPWSASILAASLARRSYLFYHSVFQHSAFLSAPHDLLLDNPSDPSASLIRDDYIDPISGLYRLADLSPALDAMALEGFTMNEKFHRPLTILQHQSK